VTYRHYPAHPLAIFSSLWQHRQLIWQLTKRDVVGRYRGSVMGFFWSFFHPIMMLGVYTFVFSVVFKARWGSGSVADRTEFALLLFAGLITFQLFAECVNQAPTLILGNASYVKKIVFPLEIMPWVSLGGTIFNSLISASVLIVFFAFVHRYIPWTAILLPLVWLPLLFFVLGLSWFLASTGVFVRDIGQVVGIFTTAMLFLSPVFYSVTALPEEYRPWLYLNPLTFILEQVRKVVIWGSQPDWTGWVLYLLGSFVVAALGFAWFQKTRRGFADVL
jgi:lipopolysaccharide transport system permease protein